MLAYTVPATNPIQDLAGNDASAIATEAVTNNTGDTTAPVFQSPATVDGTSLVLTYDELLDQTSTPAATDFAVTVAGTGVTPDGVVVNADNTVTVTLPAPGAAFGEAVTLAYTVPATNPIQDLAGNDAGAIATEAVTNNTAEGTPPVFQSPATVDGTSLVLTAKPTAPIRLK